MTGAPIAPATAFTPSDPSAIGASSTNQHPSEKPGATVAATARARRVLPTPPTPVSVTNCSRPTSELSSATSSLRPISSVRWVGRFVAMASIDRNAGNRPSPTWMICWAADRSRRRCDPRSTSVIVASPLTRPAVIAEHTT